MTQDEITNLIYEALFDRTRDSLIEEARGMKGFGAGAGSIYDFDDMDEAMRDCLSEQALKALATVESYGADLLDVYRCKVSLDTIANTLQALAHQIKALHGGIIPLWRDSHE